MPYGRGEIGEKTERSWRDDLWWSHPRDTRHVTSDTWQATGFPKRQGSPKRHPSAGVISAGLGPSHFAVPRPAAATGNLDRQVKGDGLDEGARFLRKGQLHDGVIFSCRIVNSGRRNIGLRTQQQILKSPQQLRVIERLRNAHPANGARPRPSCVVVSLGASEG